MFLACVFSVQAQTLINNCTGGYNINASGQYVLSNSIVNNGTCINISVSNVTLDCKGFNVTGNTTGAGVLAGGGLNNITVKNCRIYNFSEGINFALVTGSRIFNNRIMYNAVQAIWFQWATNNNNVTNNTLNNNSGYGFCAGGTAPSNNNNNTLIGNTASFNGWDGFNFNQSSNNTVMNNTANYNAGFGFYITNQSSNNTFTGNTANNNSEGFRIEINATHNTFNNNRAINNSVFGIDFPGSSCLFNAFTSSILSNPAGWDLRMDSPNLSFYNATLGAEYAPVKVSFTRYNGTMRMTGVQNPPADPAGWVNIAKYVNISKPVGTYLVLNISYSAADIANVQENTLRLLRFTGTWVGTNSTVYAAQNFVSARLTNYSSFGLFGQQQQQQRISGGGGGSATRAFYRILESEGEELRENQVVEKKMRSNDVFAFKMDAVKHALTVLNIDSAQKQVIIRIASVPKTYVLKLGKTVNVDADGNGYDDLAITLKSVLVGSADFVIQRIPENIPAPAALQVSDAGLEEPEEDVYAEHVAEPAPVEPAPVTEPRQALQPAVKSRSSNNGLIIALLVIAFAVAYYFMYGSRGRKKKHH